MLIVFELFCSVMLLTRQTYGPPGESSSYSQSLKPIAGASGPSVIVLVLLRSVSVSAWLSGRNHTPFSSVCPLSLYIYANLPLQLMVMVPAPPAVKETG